MTEKKSLLEQLNEKQREAVAQIEGPMLILAGAGSGKTRTLTFRVAYLIKEKNIKPQNVLAVTFTNKAAQEMAERVKKLLGLSPGVSVYSQNFPHIGTFHAICVKILRKEIEKIGYKKSFVIYDDQDQLALMKRVMKELQLSQDQLKPQAILGAISNAKNKLIDAESFALEAGSYFEEKVAQCYNRYQQELKKGDAVDFDDIIMLTVKIFEKYPEVLRFYQELFRYMMVDEYQDTNPAQYKFLSMLAARYQNLCVVGDDWQSIYGWRGADVQNILDFEHDYPKAKVVLLEQNYRSTQTILDAAYCVISQNVNRKDKKLWTENSQGQLITSYEARDEKEEARFVVEQIQCLQREMELKLNDFAVLYRTNAQSRALEEYFMRAAIPYKIIGGVKFYQRKEIKDMLAYLHLIQNSLDKINFARIVNVPARGLGDKTVEKIINYADEEQADILQAIEKLGQNSTAAGQLGLKGIKLKALLDFGRMMRTLQSYTQEHPLSILIEKVYRDTGYQMMLLKEGEEGLVRDENVKELLTVAKKYDEFKADGLANFLEEVALVSQTDKDLGVKDSVPLMTMHSAKGLEFEVVFIVGMEEGILPHSRALLSEREMEEERRLCYVGITRAKQKAYLLYTVQRNIFGTSQSSVKSRFVDEIDPALLEEHCQQNDDMGYFGEDDFSEEEESIFIDDLAASGRRKANWWKKNKKEAISKKDRALRDGDMVSHPEFGKGIVISQDENLITVAFPKLGLKKLAKGIAPLERI
jgi:DNA helicase-2/ATP-dependent DNA helicase PcrA